MHGHTGRESEFGGDVPVEEHNLCNLRAGPRCVRVARVYGHQIKLIFYIKRISGSPPN